MPDSLLVFVAEDFDVYRITPNTIHAMVDHGDWMGHASAVADQRNQTETNRNLGVEGENRHLLRCEDVPIY